MFVGFFGCTGKGMHVKCFVRAAVNRDRLNYMCCLTFSKEPASPKLKALNAALKDSLTY